MIETQNINMEWSYYRCARFGDSAGIYSKTKWFTILYFTKYIDFCQTSCITVYCEVC